MIDLDGGAVQPGDELEVVIRALSEGNDTAAGVSIVDPLLPGMSYVPGSLQITQGGSRSKTDMAGDDIAEWSSQQQRVTFFVSRTRHPAKAGRWLRGPTVGVHLPRDGHVIAAKRCTNQSDDRRGESGAPFKLLADSDPGKVGAQAS